ncbi:MAG: thioredoxin-like domain-containing protein [Verrucomicrobiota bacterium]
MNFPLLITTLASLSFIATPAQSAETAAKKESPEESKASKKSEQTVLDFLSDKLVDAKGKKIAANSLKGKMVGIYFSANWCPPCHQFTPLLVDFRNKNKDDFEVIFVSSDYSDADKKAYMETYKMKWPSLAGSKSQQGDMLAQAFQIPGIPTLIIIAPDGTPLTAFGREFVMSDPEGSLKIWQDAAAKVPSS